MSRKDSIHFSEQRQEDILKGYGLFDINAKEIAKITHTMSFYMLDNLFEALKLIKKGAPEK